MDAQNPAPKAQTPQWERPAVEWEERYEPVVLALSCAAQPGNCSGASRL